MNTNRTCRFHALPAAALALLAACAPLPRPSEIRPSPNQVRSRIVDLLPAATPDAQAWAADMQAAFAALELEPQASNLCAVIAVTAQESSFNADPLVPGLAIIAKSEIARRARALHVPQLVVRAALTLESPNGRSYAERIAAVRTEKELSTIYEDIIGRIPLGKRLFADANPVRTGGPMQVSIAFAEAYSREHGYPYAIETSIRHEVFTRRGGLYFGIAHLLGYPAHYDRPIYRFADFNAGWYASRNAAFQNAVSLATGIALALDGDLTGPLDKTRVSAVGPTELAVRSLSPQLDMNDAQIHRALGKGGSHAFADTPLYERAFRVAEQVEGHSLPRALIPHIALSSPKIKRKLTTRWFASRVDQRYRACMKRADSKPETAARDSPR